MRPLGSRAALKRVFLQRQSDFPPFRSHCGARWAWLSLSGTGQCSHPTTVRLGRTLFKRSSMVESSNSCWENPYRGPRSSSMKATRARARASDNDGPFESIQRHRATPSTHPAWSWCVRRIDPRGIGSEEARTPEASFATTIVVSSTTPSGDGSHGIG